MVAMCAARLANLTVGSNQKKARKQGPPIDGPSTSAEQAAKQLNVSPKSVERARKVLKLRAEWKAGRLLRDTVRRGGDRKSKCPTGTLIPDGVTKRQSSRWQQVARLEEDTP